MEDRSLDVLEYGKVLTRLAELCVSEAGKNAALALRPLKTLEKVHAAAALFDEARGLFAQGFTLASFPDISGALNFLETSAADLDVDALWALRQCLSQAQDMVQALEERADTADSLPLLRELASRSPVPRNVLSALGRCIGDNGLLRDESSPGLSLVRGEIRRIHQQCIRKVKEYAERYNILHYLQDTFMTLASDRYVLPLKANFKGRLQGVIHEYSQTGETCYFEPMFLLELNNELQELKKEEREEERKVIRELTNLIREALPAVKGVNAFLVRLDVLSASLKLAALYDGLIPEVAADTGVGVRLEGARHPLLELASLPAGEGCSDGKHKKLFTVQAVDVTLLPGQLGLVISGGNAGGKTVSLKTLGLIALMAFSGLPTPVRKGSVLPFWPHIFAFIGDAQNLEDHVSTFTAQIEQLSRIWPLVGPGGLVILDEFGAGTDPAQGAALAQAVIDDLVEQGAMVAAATHFPALKAYALSRDKVRAASVLFDPKTRKPLFRLAYDQVGASQALDVARAHGMPESILRRAEQFLLLSGEDTAALIERLNSLAVEKERELDQLAEEKEKYREKRKKLDERLEAERRRLFESLQAEARAILADWKKGQRTHKQTLKDLSGVRKNLTHLPVGDTGEERLVGEASQNALSINDLRPGLTVRYAPWGKNAVVTEVDTRKKRARVDINSVFLWVEADELEALNASASPRLATVKIPVPESAPLRLDVRGLRADVALSELVRFLDAAMLRGASSVEVIHGRGTGALRKQIHEFLPTFPPVKSFSLAPEDQGGDGMTRVELK